MAKTDRTLSRPKNRLISSSKTSRPSGSKANAAGYAKRQARKPKSTHGLSSDVYEYAPEALRRSNVRLDLNHDEAAGYGVGIDGGNHEDREEMRARLIGENVENEGIESGDDEEIDSDAAFEESDEERFSGFFSNKGKKKAVNKKKPVVRFVDVNLNEDEEMEDVVEGRHSDNSGASEEDEEEGDDDEFINLLDVLDGKGEIEPGSDADNPGGRIREMGDDAEEDEEEEGDSDDDDSHIRDHSNNDDDSLAFTPSDTEDPTPEALDKLQNFISTLNPTAKKRKALDGPDTSSSTLVERTRKQRRLFLNERTEAGTENEFRARNSGSKLNLDDFLEPLASQPSTLLSLKKSTKALAPSSKVKTLSAPLPQRTQDRLDREAAYEQTKEEVDKWSGTMKRIREAEHLSFPLQAQPTGRVSNLELAAKFKPTTALENSVDALLKSAKLRDEDIQHTEEAMLKMNKVSVEEVAQRRAELRKMRELMFRAETKAKRIAKIKSKTYRKIKRKEREKLGEKLGEGEESETEEGRLKREVGRARERATLRHKHTGKWAKQMRGREGDEQGRKDIEEMLERGEKLRRRIKGVRSDEESGDDDDEDDSDDGGNGEDSVDKLREAAFDELQKIDLEESSISAPEQRAGKTIFDMKFMKDAMARQQQTADRMADDFIKEIGTTGEDAEGSEMGDAAPPDMNTASGVVAVRTGGRVVYRPGTTADPRQVESHQMGSLASDTSSVTLRSTDLVPPPVSHQHQRLPTPEPSSTEFNPWLVPQGSDVARKVPRKQNEILLNKDSTAPTKLKNKLKKQARKWEEEKEKAKDDAVVEISMANVLSLGGDASATNLATNSTNATTTKESRKASKINGGTADDDSDVNSEVEAQETALAIKGNAKPKGPKAFEQRDLVALAFAGDNVVHEFEEAKRREIAADAPREVDTTIPGWGSWGGAGLRKAPPKPQRIKKIAGVDPKTRADYGKAHVIISEKRDKKAAKYLVKDLPYPYTSKAQFERIMEQPLGTEWNTRVAFQRGTLPRVVKKPGMIINPLEKRS